jgi:hypothetical protein
VLSRVLIHPLLQSRQNFFAVNFGPGQRSGRAFTVFQNSVGRNRVRTDRLDDPERPNVFQRPGPIRTKDAHSHSMIVSQRSSIIARSLERNMAYFPAELLKCVAFIGYKDGAGKFHFAGSAFWVSRDGPQDIKDQYRPAYLVTAAHVIDKAQESGTSNLVWVRTNTKDEIINSVVAAGP